MPSEEALCGSQERYKRGQVFREFKKASRPRDSSAPVKRGIKDESRCQKRLECAIAVCDDVGGWDVLPKSDGYRDVENGGSSQDGMLRLADHYKMVMLPCILDF